MGIAGRRAHRSTGQPKLEAAGGRLPPGVARVPTQEEGIGARRPTLLLPLPPTPYPLPPTSYPLPPTPYPLPPTPYPQLLPLPTPPLAPILRSRPTGRPASHVNRRGGGVTGRPLNGHFHQARPVDNCQYKHPTISGRSVGGDGFCRVQVEVYRFGTSAAQYNSNPMLWIGQSTHAFAAVATAFWHGRVPLGHLKSSNTFWRRNQRLCSRLSLIQERLQVAACGHRLKLPPTASKYNWISLLWGVR